MVIDDFKKALENKDYKLLAECFANRSRLFDYCPSTAGLNNFYIYGSKAIDMFYHNKFVLGGLEYYDVQVRSETVIDFYGKYSGNLIHAVGGIQDFDEETGLIRNMVILPA